VYNPERIQLGPLTGASPLYALFRYVSHSHEALVDYVLGFAFDLGDDIMRGMARISAALAKLRGDAKLRGKRAAHNKCGRPHAP
jgi:hypothetical protein